LIQRTPRPQVITRANILETWPELGTPQTKHQMVRPLQNLTGSTLNHQTGSTLNQQTGSALHQQTGSALHQQTRSSLDQQTGSLMEHHTGSALGHQIGKGFNSVQSPDFNDFSTVVVQQPNVLAQNIQNTWSLNSVQTYESNQPSNHELANQNPGENVNNTNDLLAKLVQSQLGPDVENEIINGLNNPMTYNGQGVAEQWNINHEENESIASYQVLNKRIVFEKLYFLYYLTLIVVTVRGKN